MKINDEGRIFWVYILIMRSSLKVRRLWRRRRRRRRKVANNLLYFLKIRYTKKKRQMKRKQYHVRRSVSASKWKTRNRKGIVWVYNTYSDINHFWNCFPILKILFSMIKTHVRVGRSKLKRETYLSNPRLSICSRMKIKVMNESPSKKHCVLLVVPLIWLHVLLCLNFRQLKNSSLRTIATEFAMESLMGVHLQIMVNDLHHFLLSLRRGMSR